MKTKYIVTFYTIHGSFYRICTRSFKSALKYAIKTAWQYKALFKIKKK